MQPLKYLDEMLPWNDRLQMLECISAIEEAPDVMTFSFKTTEDNWFRYTPGQFVTLELPLERADGLGLAYIRAHFDPSRKWPRRMPWRSPPPKIRLLLHALPWMPIRHRLPMQACLPH